MKKTNGTVCDCIVCSCPYCDKEVIEVGGNVQDLTMSDFEEENEIECPHCKKTFICIIGDE